MRRPRLSLVHDEPTGAGGVTLDPQPAPRPWTPPASPLTRGVYLAPYLVQGWPALVVIDSRGWAVRHTLLAPDVNEDGAWAELETWLDRFDPKPQLRLTPGGLS